MRKLIFVNILFFILFFCNRLSAEVRFGEILCKKNNFHCLKIKRKDSWGALFPDEPSRNLIKRINRMNVFLRPDMLIAVPDQIEGKTLAHFSPMPDRLDSAHEKTVLIDIEKQAWAAYDHDGFFLKWGPVSSGKASCPNEPGGCLTPKGFFRAQLKKGAACVSGSYPKWLDGERGGAPMPYCIYFHKGFTIHGSDELPGYPSSHGCVNLFQDDAKWLNEQFITTASSHEKGTAIKIK